MEELIFWVFIFAVYHLVYESILAPSFRLKLRYKLFTLRDEIRRIKIEYPEELSDDVFRYVDSSISSSIQHMPSFTMSVLVKGMIDFESDENLRDKVNKRIQLVDSCKIQEVKDISRSRTNITMETLAVNFGGWIPYIVPVILVVIFLGRIRSLVEGLLYLPNYQFPNQHELNPI